MKIFIDNGHALMTAGKRSPDGQFREPFYNREIARWVVADLRERGLDAELLVPEDDDIPLAERVRRVNAACFLLGKQNVILSAFMWTPQETAANGLMRPDGVSIHARGRRSPINLQNVFARQQSRISPDVASEPTCQTVIWTGRKASISWESHCAQQCWQRTSLCILDRILSICRVDLVSRPSLIPTLRASLNTLRTVKVKRHP